MRDLDVRLVMPLSHERRTWIDRQLVEGGRTLFELYDSNTITLEEFTDCLEEEQARRPQAGLTTTGPMTESQPPARQIGAYRIIEEIGMGGMGVVYRARHISSDFAQQQGGDVALKVLHQQYVQNSVFRGRFVKEAALGVRLSHPAIVSVHELIVDSGVLALVMELVEGQPLSELLEENPEGLDQDHCIDMMETILHGVSAAHAAGVVHRDLKPENILIDSEGRPKILDFGIAKDVDSSSTKTGTGLGTPYYMAPEQYKSASEVDQRADVYALGVTLYEMVSGRLPWDWSASAIEVLILKSKGELIPVENIKDGISPTLLDAIAVATALEPDDRFESVESFSKALRERVSRPRTTSPKPRTQWSRPLLLAGFGLSLGVVLMVRQTGSEELPVVEPSIGLQPAALATEMQPESDEGPSKEESADTTERSTMASSDSDSPPQIRTIASEPTSAANTEASSEAPSADANVVPIPEAESKSEGSSTPDTRVRVTLVGDATRLSLISTTTQETLRVPGEVPPGSYNALVKFPSEEAFQIGPYSIGDVGSVTFDCTALFADCTMK